MPTIRLLISGKVQGVFFRASTRQQAEALGITGWVRNCADGSVEVVATGTPTALDQFKSWCREGPPAAVVTSVKHQELPEADFEGFRVRKS